MACHDFYDFTSIITLDFASLPFNILRYLWPLSSAHSVFYPTRIRSYYHALRIRSLCASVFALIYSGESPPIRTSTLTLSVLTPTRLYMSSSLSAHTTPHITRPSCPTSPMPYIAPKSPYVPLASWRVWTREGAKPATKEDMGRWGGDRRVLLISCSRSMQQLKCHRRDFMSSCSHRLEQPLCPFPPYIDLLSPSL